MGTEMKRGDSSPTMIPNASTAATPSKNRLITVKNMSNPPEGIHDAQPHSADSRQQATHGPDKKSETKPESQNRLRKDKRRQQTGEGQADNRDSHVGENQTQEAAKEGDDDRLRQNEEKNSAPGKTDGFKDGEFGGALPDGDSHGVAGDEEKREEHDAADGEDQEFDVSELLDEICGEGGFRLGLGLKRGVGKLFVNGLGDADGVIGAIELDHVPSCRAFDGIGCVLVKVFPLQPELALVATRTLAVINAVEIELPRTAAIESSLDGDAIADFPMEAFGRAGAGNSALAVFQEIVPLVVRHHKLRHHLALIFGVDDKLWKEVLFVLVDPAEPVIVRDRFNAGNGKDLVAVGDRH